MASFKSVKGVPQPGKRQARKLGTTIKEEKGTRYRSAVTGKYVTRSSKPPKG